MSLDKTVVAQLVERIRENTYLAGDVEHEGHAKLTYLFGAGSTVEIGVPGQRPIRGKIPDDSELGPSLVTVDDGVTALDEALAEIGKDEIIGARVSKKAVVSAIEELVRRMQPLPGEPVTADGHVRPLLQGLRSKVGKWRVRMPVDNLHLRIAEPLQIAGVQLSRGADCLLEVLGQLFEVVDRSTTPPEGKRGGKEHLARLLCEEFPVSATWAMVEVEGDADGAVDLARVRVETAVNLLRCYSTVLFARDQKPYIGLRGVVHRVFQPAVASGPGADRWHVKQQAVGYVAPYQLDPEKLVHLREHCAFDALETMLGKETDAQTPMERAIATAVNWVGRGVVTDDQASRALFLTIGLERTLLDSGEAHVDIAERVVRRLSFLLGKSKEARLRISRRARQLYDLRSQVAHTGQSAIREEDVAELEGLAVSALIRMAEGISHWPTLRDFVQWVDERTYE